MPWIDLKEPLKEQPLKYCNAHLYNKNLHNTQYRLLVRERDSVSIPRFGITIFPDSHIFDLRNGSFPIEVIIEPTFPNSLISKEIIDDCNLALDDNKFIINPSGSILTSDIFNHPIYIMGTITLWFLFNGDNAENTMYYPQISNQIRSIDFGVIDAPSGNFILIGADILSRIVTVFSNKYIMIGADEESEILHIDGLSSPDGLLH